MRLVTQNIRAVVATLRTAILVLLVTILSLTNVQAQNFRITDIQISGNQRIETSTIIALAGIARGETLTAGQMNEAIQKIRESDLFSEVEADIRGERLVLNVVEKPTVNVVAFEGNERLSDDALGRIVRSLPRRVFSKQVVQEDAQTIAQAYADQGRLTATVTPRIIQRSDNRVDVVYEIAEGGVVEIQRISFVGNRSFSDRRLRGVLSSKQAGLFRLLLTSDTFVQDRVDFDKQVLRDFYLSRGYIDFQVLNVNAELTDRQDAFLLTFRVQEGQQFSVGDVSVSSELSDVDAADFENALRLRSGRVYSPDDVDNTIDGLEVLALRKGLDFVRVEPRVTRNDATLTLDVEFVMTRGPRVFVERIDITGNTTTQDRVIRRQFRTVEGDPFNPREIRAAAQRIRALRLFADANVSSREGSDPSQRIVDVTVEEQGTGTLSLGANYNSTNGVSGILDYNERNLRGRGQALRFSLRAGKTSQAYLLDFTEPAFLGRDVSFGFATEYAVTDSQNASLDTETIRVRPSLQFGCQ